MAEPTSLIALAVAIVAYALVSRWLEHRSVTMPMVFLTLGWLGYALGIVELDAGVEGVALLAEFTLAILLFSDATRINLKVLRRDVALPLRLLGIGLPLTVALGTLAISVLLPDLSIWEAALLAAILAPTDAALGQAVVEDPAVPIRIRQGLNVESGLNDGLVVPLVTLFVALSLSENNEAGFWATFVVRQVGLGVALGVAIGGLGGWLMLHADRRELMNPIAAQLATLGLAVLALASALSLGSNGFIAAFVAGLTFGSLFDAEEAAHRGEFSEDASRLLTMVAFAVFGNIFVAEALADITVPVALCAVAALTILRMVPVAIALASMRPAPQTILFVGWFGPRGLASILFGLQLLEHELMAAEQLFNVITWTVIGSVFLHGISAGPGASRYGAWFERANGQSVDPMPEAEDVQGSRTRSLM